MHTQVFVVKNLIVFHCLVQNEFGDTALVTAVNKGHLHVAEILVKNGADVNFRNKVRALILERQVHVCIMWPIIRHEHAACTVCSIHAYILVPPFDANKILSLCVLVVDFD